MKVLVTGANGFVAKNLISTLEYMDNVEVLAFSRADDLATLKVYCSEADFVVHLAGVNRTENVNDFYDINSNLTEIMLSYLKASNNQAPILLSSSIQAELDNDYGKSKKIGEDIVRNYGIENNVKTYILRLPNLFGKWSKPFYNSVIATWCHQVSRSETLEISNPDYSLNLLYVDDLVQHIIDIISGKVSEQEANKLQPIYTKTLQEIADLLYEFEENKKNRYISDMADGFTKKLYSTYLSFLAVDNFKYPLITHSDERGSFTELVKAQSFGQVSVNVSSAYETKGEHYHHTKNEKFIVISGKASIKFRNIYTDEVIEYIVSEDKYEVVDIPPGYTHNITNLLEKDLVTIMWVNEPFDPNTPDTYQKLVEEKI